MALKIELGPDRDRGPGYGLLRLEGAAVVAGPLEVSIQSNQKGQFLGADGGWQNAEAWHALNARADGAGVMVPVGPEMVDPVASLPPNCILRLKVKGLNDFGGVNVRGLLPSSASGSRPAGEGDRVVHLEPVPEPMVLTAPVEDRLVQPPVEPPVAPKGKPPMGLIIGGIVAALVVAGAAAGFFLFKGDKTETPPPATATTEAPANPAPVVQAPSEINSREDVAKFIQSNPSAADALAAASKLVGKEKLDLAMLVYQYAARSGSQEANVALGHMYDPETWTAKTSPMPQADAETAAYWYEPAAQAGNVEAERRLGQILVQLNPSGFQRDKGRDWLSKAAAAGDAKAKAALDAVK